MKKRMLWMTIAFMGLIIALSAYILNIRASIYPYDVTKDYIYDFSQTDATVIHLKLKKGKIDLSTKHPGANHTAFLKVDVKTTLLGHYFQPSIDVAGGQESLTQYVEYGADGIRYVNISPLNFNNKPSIKLYGKHISIEDQTVELVLFKNQDAITSKILILAPHPDDAEIAAYGLYSSNKDTYIITITAGDAGDHKYNEIYQNRTAQFLKKGKLRTWNSITVPLLGGISFEQTVNMGFFDGTLETMHKDKSTPATGLYTQASDIATYRKQNISRISKGLTGTSDWHSLVSNLEYLLKKIEPDVIVTPYPALDKHKDHKFSTIALFEAIMKSNITNGKLYLYTNHFVLNEHYPYGKMNGIVSIPPNFGETFFFDSIFSHTLTMNDQKDKMLALEAMNDLRLDTEWRFSNGAINIAIRNITRDITGVDFSYFRRAVRCNELFFVTKISNIYNDDIRNRIIGKADDIRPIVQHRDAGRYLRGHRVCLGHLKAPV